MAINGLGKYFNSNSNPYGVPDEEWQEIIRDTNKPKIVEYEPRDSGTGAMFKPTRYRIDSGYESEAVLNSNKIYNEQDKKTTWQKITETLGAGSDMAIADVVNTARTIGGSAERYASAYLGDSDMTLRQNIQGMVENLTSGDRAKTLEGLWQFYKASVYPIGGVVSAGMDTGEAIMGGIDALKTGERDVVSGVVDGIKKSTGGVLLSRTSRADFDNILKPIEDRIVEASGVAELADWQQAIAGGVGSLPTSLMVQGSNSPLAYALLFLKSFRNTQEDLWAREQREGVRFDDTAITLNAVANGGLEVVTEKMFNLMGKAVSPIAKRLSGTKFGVLMSDSSGLFAKIAGLVTGKTGQEAIEATGKLTLKQFLKETGITIAKGSIGEGSEEIINAIGSAIVAKMTTDSTANFWGADESSLLNARALALAFLSGATGATITTTGQSVVAGVMNKIGDKNIDDLTKEDIQKIDEGLMTAAQDTGLQKTMQESIMSGVKTTVDIAQNEDIQSIDDLFDTTSIGLAEDQTIRTDVQGIVAEGFVEQIPGTQQTVSQRIVPTEAYENLKRNSIASQYETVVDAIKEKVKTFKDYIIKGTMRGSVPISYKFGEVRRATHSYRNSQNMASANAENIVAKIYNPAGAGEMQELAQVYMLYADIVDDIERGLYPQENTIIPVTRNEDGTGGQTPAQVMETWSKLSEEIKKDENKVPQKLVERRKKYRNEYITKIEELSKRAGLPIPNLRSRENHIYHFYPHHAKTGAKHEEVESMSFRGAGQAGVYLAREGSTEPYLTNVPEADFMMFHKFLKDINRLEYWLAVKEQDVSADLAYSKTQDWVIPKGYSEVTPGMMGLSAIKKPIDKNEQLAAVMMRMQNDGIEPGSIDWNVGLAEAAEFLNKYTLVVPTEIADMLKHEFKSAEHHPAYQLFDKLSEKGMQLWKYSKLRLPVIAIRYNLRNAPGDLDAFMAGLPLKSFKKVSKAIKELKRYYYNNGELTTELEEYILTEGLSTGQAPVELGKLFNSELLDINIDERTTEQKGVAVAKKAWQALTLEKFTQFREQILRYAAYLSFKEDIENNFVKTGIAAPTNYSASNYEEIDSIKTISNKASKMANDLLGAYNDTSLLSNFLAKRVRPFHRFDAINYKRYFRMAKNAISINGKSAEMQANEIQDKYKRFAKVGGMTMLRAVKLVGRLSAFYLAPMMWNAWAAGSDDDELPENIRNSFHITIPRWMTGTDKIYYFANFGSFAEMFSKAGLWWQELYPEVNDIMTGKRKIGAVLKDISRTPINEAFNSSFPIAKIAYELITGQQTFPDPSSPTTIRDKWAYIFNQVGLEAEYKLLTGKTMDEGNYWQEKADVIFNSVMPGDAAVYDVWDMIEDWKEVNNEPSRSGGGWNDTSSAEFKRSQAAYNYKQSIRLEDWKAAEKYLAEYAMNGGTKQGIKQSVQSILPTHFMSKADKNAFIASLDENDRKRYDQAVNYVNELLDITLEMG